MATTTRRKASAAQWAERVQRWQQSGLTAERFGRREGLDPRQLRWWPWSLGKRAAGSEGASVTSFLPVRVVAAPTAALRRQAAPPPGPEAEPDGVDDGPAPDGVDPNATGGP